MPHTIINAKAQVCHLFAIKFLSSLYGDIHGSQSQCTPSAYTRGRYSICKREGPQGTSESSLEEFHNTWFWSMQRIFLSFLDIFDLLNPNPNDASAYMLSVLRFG